MAHNTDNTTRNAYTEANSLFRRVVNQTGNVADAITAVQENFVTISQRVILSWGATYRNNYRAITCVANYDELRGKSWARFSFKSHYKSRYTVMVQMWEFCKADDKLHILNS